MIALSQFAEALLPDTHVVLGVKLRPLSVGHVLMLVRLGSPLVGIGNRKPDPADIALAVLVCSMDWRTLKRRVGGWGFRARLAILTCFAAVRILPIVQWQKYFADGTKRPKSWSVGGKGKTGGLPFWVWVFTTVAREYRYAEDDAMDMPCAFAIWLATVAVERAGQIELASQAELEVMAEAKRN